MFAIFVVLEGGTPVYDRPVELQSDGQNYYWDRHPKWKFPGDGGYQLVGAKTSLPSLQSNGDVIAYVGNTGEECLAFLIGFMSGYGSGLGVAATAYKLNPQPSVN